eukprot:COSAG01_NODE_152_length_23937_cov_122.193976_29_plen_120_part_00
MEEVDIVHILGAIIASDSPELKLQDVTTRLSQICVTCRLPNSIPFNTMGGTIAGMLDCTVDEDRATTVTLSVREWLTDKLRRDKCNTALHAPPATANNRLPQPLKFALLSQHVQDPHPL